MSWADDIAQRVGQKSQGDESAKAWQIHKAEIIRSESASLWAQLSDSLTKEIVELTSKLPNIRLVPNVPNDRSWIVDGPGIHLEVWRDGATVRTAFGNQQDVFGIDVDPHSGITFTSNGVPETVWSVKQSILKPIGDFLTGDSDQPVRRMAYGRR